MRIRYWLWLLLLLGPLVLQPGCRTQIDPWPNSGKKRVLASFAPLYCFTKNVAGDDVEVRCLLTATGPHDYHLSNQEEMLIRKADLILLNGLELDAFVDNLLNEKGKKDPRIYHVGDALPHEHLRHPDEGPGHAEHGHMHGDHDPHVWLAPDKAMLMVALIAAKLGEIDPAHKQGYDDRAQKYSRELQKLHDHGVAAFKNKKNNRLVSTHDSLGYFADAFKLEIVGSIQPKAGIEGDARKLTELVKLCKEKNVSVIAVEPQYSRGPAETLQRQLKTLGLAVTMVEVDPLETAPRAKDSSDPDPGYYLKRMVDNIDELAKALP